MESDASPMGMEDMVEIDLTGLVLPEKIETARKSADGRTARFVIEPLERGFGHTLGNSVRRVLLSSLRGAAVWAFRIDGVVHEHQTVQGVVEDVHQIIQNLKALVVTLDDDTDEATLELRASGAGPVTAAAIGDRAGVAILDPEHHILTLQEDRDFHMELRVNKGRGFVLADQHSLEKGAPVDLVRIDSVYNPVRRANFEVKETRVGQRTDFDQLSLHVETDGSVSPADAVATASELVRKHLEYLLYFGEGGLPELTPEGATPVPEQVRDLFGRPIEDLAELSVRSRNSLQKEAIRTVGELIQRTEEEMLDIENFGKKSLKEIQDFLAEHSLRFGMRIKEAEDGRLFFMDEEEAAEAKEPGEE
jgi:DNA-directed RNA polymerase subunit alpha